MQFPKESLLISMFRCARSTLCSTTTGVFLGATACASAVQAYDWHPFSPDVMRQKDEGLVCAPKILRRGDILEITFLTEHSGDSGFIDPSGEFVYTSFRDYNEAKVAPIWDHNELSRVKKIKINVDKFVGDKGGGVARRLFLYRGIYRFAVSPALDAEDVPEQGACFVKFLDGRVPPPPSRRWR